MPLPGWCLSQWIVRSTIPPVTRNTLYFVYLPPDISAVAADGTRSCRKFCGYHGNVKGTRVLHAVEPHVSCQGCSFGNGVVDSLTKVSSHEPCAAITDPEGDGWYDDVSWDKIGDICNNEVTRLGPYTIQEEWSDSRQRCVIS